jgi:hypothetical protein
MSSSEITFEKTVLLATFMLSIASVYINVLNAHEIDKIKNDVANCENRLKNAINIIFNKWLIKQFSVESKFSILNKQITLLIENNKTIIEDIQLLRKSEDRFCIKISPNASINTFSPIKIPSVIHTEDHYDDELLNECYDIIPMNNLKKNTGLSWLFN